MEIPNRPVKIDKYEVTVSHAFASFEMQPGCLTVGNSGLGLHKLVIVNFVLLDSYILGIGNLFAYFVGKGEALFLDG